MVISRDKKGDGKHQECTDRAIIDQIRKLSEDAYSAAFTRSSLIKMDELRLTRRGVLEIICEYINGGGVVDVTITDSVPGKIGQPMYVLYPTYENQDLYIKVRIDTYGPYPLIVISVHE